MIQWWNRSIFLLTALGMMLALGAPMPVIGANGNGHDDDDDDVIVEIEPRNKDLIKVTHVFKQAKPGGSGAGGGGATSGPGWKLASWRWDDYAVLTYKFYAGTLAGTGLTASVAAENIQNGFIQWPAAKSKVPTTNAITVDDPNVAIPEMPLLDEINAIGWKNLGNTGTLAVTYTWSNRFTGRAVEFDMIFNSAYPWSTLGDAGAYDVWNIAAHESGHVMGLDHPKTGPTDVTMYKYAGKGETIKRDLAPGDVTGITNRYP